MTLGSLESLVRQFLDGTLPRREWTHSTHLAVGAWHVHRFGAEEALARLRRGIRALNDRHGTANTDTSGYHETVTVAYVRLIDEFLSAFEASTPLEVRLEQLLSGTLGDRALLLRFWSRDLLMSPRARATWTPPDVMPLAVPDATTSLP